MFPIVGGAITPYSGLTDSNGYFTATFQAPSVSEQKNIRIVARAYKTGNADGSSHRYIEVVPPLSVAFAVGSVALKSEASMNGTIHVTYYSQAVEGATVTMTSEAGGSFTPQVGTTDADGWFEFKYTAPQALTKMNVTLTASVTKTGYWAGSAQTKVLITPRTLSVDVTANPSTVESRDNASIAVHVASDGEPVANVTITMSSDVAGEFLPLEGQTDANGDFQMVFTTPETTSTAGITVTASAAKTGYVSGQNQTALIVNPVPGAGVGGLFGLSLTTLLLITIPVVVVVVVVVLIKKKIIVFGRSEEDQ
jgi:hypothetical protein